VYRGAVGDVAGGNLLYLRSIWSALNGAEARRRAMKLLAIAVTLGNLGYAHAILRASEEAGVLTPAEGAALRELCFKRVFVPDAWGGGRWRARIASAFGMASQLAAGLFWRAVSTPESNRLGGYPFLFRRPSPLWRRSRVEERYDTYYAEFRKQRPRG
jgi:hypothetical protein